LGAIYEIGALSALTEALEGLDLNDADVYVGVSAGSFIAAALANGISPHQLSRVFIEGEKSTDRFEPSILLRRLFANTPSASRRCAAGRERGLALPGGRQHDHERIRAPGTSDPDWGLQRRTKSIATCRTSSGSPQDERFPAAFAQALPGGNGPGHRLIRRLRGPDMDHVPISRAVQASAALPGLFPPSRSRAAISSTGPCARRCMPRWHSTTVST